jgi:hypothetical protein
MVNEKLIIPKENIYKTEEVRYLENQELRTQRLVAAKFFICSPDAEGQKEVGKNTIGAQLGVARTVAPPVGYAATGVAKAAGKISESVGESTGN